MADIKTVFGGWAPIGEATVTEPLHLAPRRLLTPEVSADGKLSTIAPEDQGVHSDETLRICEQLVKHGFIPVECHPRPYYWKRPGDPQLYSRGWAYQLMQEEKEKTK